MSFLLIEPLARLYILLHLLSVCIINNQIIHLFVFLAVLAGLNFGPIILENLSFAQSVVSFLDIVTYIKVTNASTSPLAESIFLEMLSLMKKYFPLRTYILMLEHGFVLRFYCYPLPCVIILGMNN